MLQGQVLQVLIAAVPKIGNFQPVGQDVITVEAHQRIAVEDDSADAADNHQAQAQVVDKWLAGGVPPDKSGNSGDDQLHINPREADDNALPLAGQGPSVGDVAIKTGRQA